MYRFSPKFALRPAAFSACAAAIVCLSGCAGISGTAVPSSLTTSIPKGSLHGGQQPIQGARVYVYAANTPTTGGSYGSASTSLIGAFPGTAQDGSGNYYVTTDANGSFSYAGTVTCPTGATQIYLLALGGNTTGHQGSGSNPALALSAALGSCSTINATTFTSMNEVTTAAMVFALNPFMLDAIHIGSPSSNNTGLINAFATVPNLVTNATGTALAVTPGGNGVAPQQTLNTLANIIAPCANSGANTSAACSSLFSHASSSIGSPTTTIGALLNIATFPTAQVANLYSDALATAPFQPALTTQPNDFSLGIAFSATTPVIRPGTVVIDGSGNIWTSSCQSCVTATAPDSLVEFSPTGAYLGSFTGSATPTTQVLHQVQGIAIDAASGFIYTTNLAIGSKPDELIKMPLASNSTTFVHSNVTSFGIDALAGVTLDNTNNVWVTSSFYPNANLPATVTSTNSSVPTANVVRLSTAGSEVAVFPPSSTGFSDPTGIGTDALNNVWVADAGSGPGTGAIGKFSGGAFATSYTPSGINEPTGVMIDGNNNIWTVDQFQPALSQIRGFNGTNASASPYTDLALYQAAITAVDGSGQVLVPSCRQSCPGGVSLPDGLIRVSQTGVSNTGAAPGPSAAVTVQLTGGGSPTYAFNGPGGVAIDASGNAWITNSVSGKLTQVVGFAAPTRQPIAATTALGTIGLLP